MIGRRLVASAAACAVVAGPVTAADLGRVPPYGLQAPSRTDAAPIPVLVVPGCTESFGALLLKCEPRDDNSNPSDPGLVAIQQSISLSGGKPYPDLGHEHVRR